MTQYEMCEQHAKKMSTDYAYPEITKKCICCGTDQANLIIECKWKTFKILWSRYNIFHIFSVLMVSWGDLSEYDVIRFETYHSICESCNSVRKKTFLIGTILEGVSFLLTIFSLSAMVMIVLQMVLGIVSGIFNISMVMFCVCVVMLAMAYIGYRLCFVFRTPAPIRHIANYGFRLLKIKTMILKD